MPIKEIPKLGRLTSLDHLRGFFIVVIIVDHLSRWPSLLALISGKALLWVTAAEGFVIISGLLVGYVRGYKNRNLPMRDISKKLISRGLLLYAWSVIATLVYTIVIWYVPLTGGAPGIPIAQDDWFTLITQTVSLQYTYVWVYFLTLYALFLVAAPIAVFLLRNNKAWLVIALSLILFAIGLNLNIEVLQWQALFFIPSVAGYYLENIRSRWLRLKTAVRVRALWTIWSITAITITLSVITTFYPHLIANAVQTINELFAKDTISLWRMIMAFIWFVGFMLLFQRFENWIGKIFGWLLLPIGTRSLTAYILHGVAIILISVFTGAGENILINTLLSTTAIMIVWALLRSPFVAKFIPS